MQIEEPGDGFARLRALVEEDDETIGDDKLDELLKAYACETNVPVSRLVEDIELQAVIYWNVVESLKRGDQPSEIKTRFEALHLVPPNTLPNPAWPRMLENALDKVRKLRGALISIVRRFGGRLLQEISLEAGLTVGVGVNLGFPPSVSFSIEHAYTAIHEMRYSPAKPAG